METILIDGYNLLHKDPALKKLAGRSLEQAREELLDRLAAYRSGDVAIVVVFDGREQRGTHGARRRPGVEARFSRPPLSADQVILDMIAGERRRASLLVVTSDAKDIGRSARAEGVRWISSEAFFRRLAGGRKPKGQRRGERQDEKPAAVAASEIDYWIKKFDRGSTDGD
jgi:predicted RNA-binding protein with PIN domain